MARTDWFQQAGWGVFAHFLTAPTMTAGEWNAKVNSVDVKALAGQLAATGCGWFFLTVGQNSGHYCAPNRTYDCLVGSRPSKCSERDLITDLAVALAGTGIRLMAYSASGAPGHDRTAMARLEWEWGFTGDWAAGAWGTPRTGKRLVNFQRHWEAVHREWSERWGRRVHGWWIDGCYFADEMYRFPDEPNFGSFAAALRAGNADRLVAFNPGVMVPLICHADEEDYTAGEIAQSLPEVPGPKVGGAQYHILSYLGSSWCAGEPRFPDPLAVGYTQHVLAKGGVITWDVGIETNGLIREPFLRQLQAIGRAVGRRA